MKNQKLVQQISLLTLDYLNRDESFYETYASVEAATQKYDVSLKELALNIGGNLDYGKIIRQIITDLRYSRYIDEQCDKMDIYRDDTYYLCEITKMIEDDNKAFGNPIEISSINDLEYQSLIKKYNLI